MRRCLHSPPPPPASGGRDGKRKCGTPHGSGSFPGWCAGTLSFGCTIWIRCSVFWPGGQCAKPMLCSVAFHGDERRAPRHHVRWWEPCLLLGCFPTAYVKACVGACPPCADGGSLLVACKGQLSSAWMRDGLERQRQRLSILGFRPVLEAKNPPR